MMDVIREATFQKRKCFKLHDQSGVVLFVALVALVAMSLAAVSLIRSVDSNNMITGNLSLKQAATNSADAGVEAAIGALSTIRDSSALNPINSDGHPLNKTNAGAGSDDTKPYYYSNLIAKGQTGHLDIKSDAAWNATKSNLAHASDSVGNEVRYIIQRMCKTAELAPVNNDCVFSGSQLDGSGQEVKLADEICEGDGCPTAGQAPMYRITVRVKDYRDSLTYVQAFVH